MWIQRWTNHEVSCLLHYRAEDAWGVIIESRAKEGRLMAWRDQQTGSLTKKRRERERKYLEAIKKWWSFCWMFGWFGRKMPLPRSDLSLWKIRVPGKKPCKHLGEQVSQRDLNPGPISFQYSHTCGNKHTHTRPFHTRGYAHILSLSHTHTRIWEHLVRQTIQQETSFIK